MKRWRRGTRKKKDAEDKETKKKRNKKKTEDAEDEVREEEEKDEGETPSPELCRADPAEPEDGDGDLASPSPPRPPFSSITFFFSFANILPVVLSGQCLEQKITMSKKTITIVAILLIVAATIVE